jgi:hypothetical protein
MGWENGWRGRFWDEPQAISAESGRDPFDAAASILANEAAKSLLVSVYVSPAHGCLVTYKVPRIYGERDVDYPFLREFFAKVLCGEDVEDP